MRSLPFVAWLSVSALFVSSLTGCQQLDTAGMAWTALKFSEDAEDLEDEGSSVVDEFETKVETPFVGDYAWPAGLNLITLEGVGLVTGLDGTGGDPPPSVYRERLLKAMRKRGVKSPNRVLASPSTALVVVRAYLPPLVEKGDHFDVEVRLPGNGEATSLAGGWLMQTYLAEAAVVAGKGVLRGHVHGIAEGPILVTPSDGDRGDLAGVLRRGKVLGGGVATKSRDMALLLRSEFRSVRNAKRVAARIGLRFHEHDRFGIRQPLAEAKTDQKVQLRIQKRYKDNFPRFVEVVRNVAFRETDAARRVRMEMLADALLDPPRSEDAAVKLEAIGKEAIPALLGGLEHPSLEIRFHAATALAYLGDGRGLPHLIEAIRREPAFRVYGLAAVAALDTGEASLALRELVHEESAEVRYGAVRALSTMDPRDPFILGEMLPEGDHPEFMLRVVESRAEPMVHLTQTRKAEIVVFGSGQAFEAPMLVKAGRHVYVKAAAGGDKVVVSRYQPGRPDRRKEVSTNVAEVIRAVAEVGGSYPDVVQMLIQAEEQHNLPGRLEIDELPRAGRIYYRRAPGGARQRSRVGRKQLQPNMFADPDDPDESGSPRDDADGPSPDGVSDERTAPVEPRVLDSLKTGTKWYDFSRYISPPTD